MAIVKTTAKYYADGKLRYAPVKKIEYKAGTRTVYFYGIPKALQQRIDKLKALRSKDIVSYKKFY